MTQATWEKPPSSPTRAAGGRMKFIAAGVVILAAVAYLIVTGTASGARFFITVDEVVNDAAYLDQSVRLTGAVIGETIQYDADILRIEFTIAHVPERSDDLAEALHDAVENPEATRLRVVVENTVKPDLLRHEAQAILTGTLSADGVFYASDLQLKCPTRFSEAAPEAVIADTDAQPTHPPITGSVAPDATHPPLGETGS